MTKVGASLQIALFPLTMGILLLGILLDVLGGFRVFRPIRNAALPTLGIANAAALGSAYYHDEEQSSRV